MQIRIKFLTNSPETDSNREVELRLKLTESKTLDLTETDKVNRLWKLTSFGAGGPTATTGAGPGGGTGGGPLAAASCAPCGTAPPEPPEPGGGGGVCGGDCGGIA
jgi:hypothetical protein